jgi:tight adherence protein C
VGIESPAVIAAVVALGVCLLATGLARWRRRARIVVRIQSLSGDDRIIGDAPRESFRAPHGMRPRELAGRLGARIGRRWPAEVGALAARADRAGVAPHVSGVELLGWKIVTTLVGVALGVLATLRYGPPALLILVLMVVIGWFGIDLILLRIQEGRRRAIQRDLPTVMDLLVLSLEAGMALDRALRTVIQDYRSALSDELRRVERDIDLGLSRSEAFDRLAQRVRLEDLRAVSRAIIQSEELGVSLVAVMQTQSREVRLSRRRAAEAEALRAPIKMLVPLVVFILPTLFLLLLGPVGLRAAAAVGVLSR